MQGEFANLCQQSLLASLELLGEIARMIAQSLGALGDEVLLPLLDLGESQRVLTCSLSGGGLALEDVDGEGGLALCGPALRTVSIGLDLKCRRIGGGFGLYLWQGTWISSVSFSHVQSRRGRSMAWFGKTADFIRTTFKRPRDFRGDISKWNDT